MRRVIFTALVLCLIATSLSAQENVVYRVQRRSLEGINEVHVIVEKIKVDAEKGSGFTDQIQTDVELKLRNSGIKVLSLEDSASSTRKATLHITVSIAKATEVYGYSVFVELIQAVNLKNKTADSLPATTWEREVTGLLPTTKLDELRRNVADLTDQFINDCLAANGK
jgi:hypothetical protein